MKKVFEWQEHCNKNRTFNLALGIYITFIIGLCILDDFGNSSWEFLVKSGILFVYGIFLIWPMLRDYNKTNQLHIMFTAHYMEYWVSPNFATKSSRLSNLLHKLKFLENNRQIMIPYESIMHVRIDKKRDCAVLKLKSGKSVRINYVNAQWLIKNDIVSSFEAINREDISLNAM